MKRQYLFILLVQGLLFGAIGLAIKSYAQERVIKPLHVWEIKTVEFNNGTTFEVSRTIRIYKFQVGTSSICKAVFQYGNLSTPLGDVPCEE